MKPTVSRHPLHRPLSLLLTCAMLLTLLLPAASAAEGQASLSLDHTTLSLAESQEYFRATLTMDVPDASSGWTQADWDSWAGGLEWYLTRDAADSPQDPDLYPNVYTGDALKNWMSWGTINGNGADGSPYFTLETPTVTVADGKATLTLDFSHGVFFENETTGNSLQSIGSGAFRYTRNVWGSFIGDYDLSVRQGADTLASTQLEVTVYESYLRYDELYQELLEIQALAQAKGRYFDIRSYGKSVEGRDQWYVVLSDSAQSVSDFETMNQLALTDPASLQKQLDAGTLTQRVPVLVNNVHPDEGPAPDAPVNLLRVLATEDQIPYNTITGLTSGQEVDMSLFDPKLTGIQVGDYSFTGYGLKISGDPDDPNGNNGRTDASEFYTFSEDLYLNVDEVLDQLIILVSPVENPDGRTYNTRPNANGFDLNRDCTNQTQPETANMARLISQWNPVAFIEFHGFTAQFLVEPCTPPHEPNLEYDLLVDNFILGAEAFGNAALATLSVQHKDEFETKIQTYYTPLRDNYDPETGWDAWDDLCTNYTPSYAMLNCGSMGFTIETPAGNEAACSLLEGGMYGILQYFTDNKDDIYHNQLEFFRRGLENEDHRDEMEVWYVDAQNQQLEADTWRVPNAENDNYFPEYWVIPVGAADQRDPAGAYEMAQFLLDNGVQVSKLTKDVTVGDVTYHAGDLVVNMYQAKRNYANCVLWAGCDASNSGFPDLYSESVSNFPEMRGFDCVKVCTPGAFDGALASFTQSEASSVAGKSQFTGVSDGAVVLANNGEEAVRAVNALLDQGTPVGLITSGSYAGDFLVSYSAYQQAAEDYILVGTGVSQLPEAYAIQRPSVYLAGRYAEGDGNKVTEGYYAQWFSQGFGYRDYQNVHNNGTSNYDVMAYDTQLGFHIVSDPAQADVIVGSVALDAGAYGQAAVAAVKGGTPYIATGAEPLDYIKENLLSGSFDYESLGMESLHTVTYPTDSIITASYAGDEDYVLYTYSCSAITQMPDGAQVLIQAADTDSHIAGCCLTEDGKALDGRVEAIALTQGGMDLTIFANSIVNRAHQQDDYRYVTNAIYSKCLSQSAMTMADLTGTTPSTGFTDVPADHWAADSIASATSQGLFKGTSGTTFDPSGTMDRAMLVTVLYRMAGSPSAAPSSFSDVPAGSWYSAAVDWAVEQDITTGIGNSSFAPQAPLTREQIAVFLYRYSGAEAPADGVLTAPDADQVSAWAVEAMEWAVAEGLITGTGGRLDPGRTATRAEVATLLVRYQAL
ncbi:S-layer homology domain-containing protein [Flavonifractor sp. An306]|uniref:S-layer homology domain-containing protein n=1 Tax=Flavonifractor sp. An306 TaxID=1965629 RepID=UPI000B39FAD0|nr:S-layer homology domain-containing protein [Flavonifractor sp. An306]OUO36603.1 hypothetical protein B5F88_13675 [Flavonifractor sp. An306]